MSDYSIILDENELFIYGEDIPPTPYTEELKQKLLNKLKPYDLVRISSLSVLGSNLDEILAMWVQLIEEKHVYVIDLSSKNINTEFLNHEKLCIIKEVLTDLAVNMKATAKVKQSIGIKHSQEKGVKFGRPLRSLPPNFQKVYNRWINKELTLAEAADACGMPKSTFYDKACKYRNKN